MRPAALAAYDDPLPDAERDALLDKAARAVVSRGLEAPAVLALEMHKPLAFVASQALIVTTPLLGPLLGLGRMQNLTRLLQEPGAVEALLVRIEEMSARKERQTPQTGETV
jgi:hypothetical protein